VPLGDQDLALRLLSLSGLPDCLHDPSELEFETDPWLFVRLLNRVLGAREDVLNQWRVEVLVIPRNTLKQLFSTNPQLTTILMQTGLHETERQLEVLENSRCLMETIYGDKLPVEACPHIKEIMEIIAGSRSGYVPVQDDSLGPFSALHAFIATTKLMKSRTLKNRFPAFIVPQKFSLIQEKPSYFYYSFSRPTSRFNCPPPARTSRVMEAIAQKISRLKNTVKLQKLDLQFITSEKQPKAVVPIHPFSRNQQLVRDFTEQLKCAETLFGLDKSTALGDPRSGFFGSFVRVSNEARDAAPYFLSGK
jgi:hypothetical protein